MRREQILEEATRIIAQSGYHGFSIQEVADGCRITNAGLLYYFGSKDQLLIALLQYRVSRDTAALAWLCSEGKPGKDLSLKSVIKTLRAIAQRNAMQPEIMRFWLIVQAESLNRLHPACEFFAERDRDTRQRFTEMLEPHVAQPDSTARQLIALMDGLAVQWLRADQGFDFVKEWDRGVAKLLPPK
jgi:AcrR family transcriptional regulator